MRRQMGGEIKIQDCLRIAEGHPALWDHLTQVDRLSQQLFRLFQPVHGLSPSDQVLLSCAALLHDIGISISYDRHHKHSMGLILASALPSVTSQEKLEIALIARYHRKADPSLEHPEFRSLASIDQARVSRIASILRMADGLDRAHENAVATLGGFSSALSEWTVMIQGPGDLSLAAWGAERKAGLFLALHGVALRFEPKGPVSAPTIR